MRSVSCFQIQFGRDPRNASVVDANEVRTRMHGPHSMNRSSEPHFPLQRDRQPFRSSRLEKAELGHRRDAIVEANLLDNLAVDHLQDRRASETHLAAGRGWEATNQEIAECRTRMGTATPPPTDDIVALGDQV